MSVSVRKKGRDLTTAQAGQSRPFNEKCLKARQPVPMGTGRPLALRR